MPRDYYEILGVPRDASKDDLKQAFRRLARKYHPDVSDAPDAEERFKEANEAYQVLSNDELRARYDRFGHAGVQGGMPPGGFGFGGRRPGGGIPDLETIFEEIFGTRSPFGSGRGSDPFGGGRGSGPFGGSYAPPGRDLRYDLAIDFEQAVFGAEVDIEVDRRHTCERCGGRGIDADSNLRDCPECGGKGQVMRESQTLGIRMTRPVTCPRCEGRGQVIDQPCRDCHGEGTVHGPRRITVKIPPGVGNDTQIRLTGEGEASEQGGPPGDLYVVLSVRPHEFFQRRGHDIILELSINVAQAALGDTVRVPTVDGDTEVQIPPGTQSGKIVKLKGKGVPRLGRGGQVDGRGDQILILTVDVPTQLSREQRDLFEQLGRTLGHEVRPHKSAKSDARSFMDRLAEMFGM